MQRLLSLDAVGYGGTGPNCARMADVNLTPMDLELLPPWRSRTGHSLSARHLVRAEPAITPLAIRRAHDAPPPPLVELARVPTDLHHTYRGVSYRKRGSASAQGEDLKLVALRVGQARPRDVAWAKPTGSTLVTPGSSLETPQPSASAQNRPTAQSSRASTAI